MTVKLIITVDLGASLTKCFYQFLVDGQPSTAKYKVFCSALRRISSTQYERQQYADNNTSILSINGEYWAAGENARETVTNVNIRSPKGREAIPKVLAIVGQVLSENVPVGTKTAI